MKIALTIHYDGSAFSGFQRQTGERTVQGAYEKALEIYFRNPVQIHCAGRTDRGVHACGQVIHFEINEKDFFFRTHDLEKMIYNLNGLLPADTSIVFGGFVQDDFHARFSCIGREYIYSIVSSRYRMPLYRKQYLWINYPVDLKKIREASEHLIGEHDFASFTKNIYKTQLEKTVRRIDRIKVIEKPPFLYFYYDGSGFLHNMIRIITGTLLMVGKGNLTPENVQSILHSQSRMHPGKTLPAFPLVLVNARYENYRTPKECNPFHNILDF
ncbi:MAG: tRNA pseudouridine(38-40) synthase TruA [Spirochaetia bacterium]|nr:tRNA pseudouridine(38-40) synthase TruA [Spirochaetia bacterium]